VTKYYFAIQSFSDTPADCNIHHPISVPTSANNTPPSPLIEAANTLDNGSKLLFDETERSLHQSKKPNNKKPKCSRNLSPAHNAALIIFISIIAMQFWKLHHAKICLSITHATPPIIAGTHS